MPVWISIFKYEAHPSPDKGSTAAHSTDRETLLRGNKSGGLVAMWLVAGAGQAAGAGELLDQDVGSISAHHDVTLEQKE